MSALRQANVFAFSQGPGPVNLRGGPGGTDPVVDP